MSKIKRNSVVTSFVFVPNLVDIDTDKAMDFAGAFLQMVEPYLDQWPESLTIEMNILPVYKTERGSSAEYEIRVSGVKNPCPPKYVEVLPAPPPPLPAPAPAPPLPTPAPLGADIRPFASFMVEFSQNLVGKLSPDDISYTLNRHGLHSITDLAVHPEKIPGVLANLKVLASPPLSHSPGVPLPPEVDAKGDVWDREIHASTRAKNKDGTWRKKQVWKVKTTKEETLHKRGYITVEETCEMLGISHHVQIQHIRRQNELFPKPEYIHGYSGYRRKDVKAWIELFGKPGANR